MTVALIITFSTGMNSRHRASVAAEARFQHVVEVLIIAISTISVYRMPLEIH